MITLALIGPIGLPELIVLGLIGLLVFGRRLPEVGRSLARSIVEFKHGLSETTLSAGHATPTTAVLPQARELTLAEEHAPAHHLANVLVEDRSQRAIDPDPAGSLLAAAPRAALAHDAEFPSDAETPSQIGSQHPLSGR